MGKNTKPMLTVLVESDKLQQLRDYAAAKQVSMGAIVNRLLDRLLSGELDGTMNSSSKSLENYIPSLTREAVEEMINSSRDSNSSGVSREVLEQYVETAIERVSRGVTIESLEQYIETAIGNALKPIETEVSELKIDAQNQFMEMRVELGK